MRHLITYILLMLVAFPLRAEDIFDPILPPDPAAAFVVTLASEPDGHATLTGDGVYSNNSMVTITCEPEVGYAFSHWTSNGETIATTSEHTFLMPTQDMHVVAHLNKLTLHTLSMASNKSGAATFTGQGQYYAGDKVTVTCTPNEDYTFQHWLYNSMIYSYDKSFSFTMPDDDIHLVAVFQHTPHSTISFSVNNQQAGFVSSTGGLYPVGTIVDFSAIAHPNYAFVHWKRNDTYFSAEPTLSYTVRDEDDYFEAVFEYSPIHPDDPMTDLSTTIYLEASPMEAATFNMPSISKHYAGEILQIIATVHPNYHIVGWYSGEKLLATTPELLYTVGKKSETLTLRATPIIYTRVTLQSQPAGAVSFNISSSEAYEMGSVLTIHATTDLNHIFDGWYIGDSLLTKTTELIYTVPRNATTLTAKATKIENDDWNPTPPSDPGDREQAYVTVQVNNANMGRTIGSAHYFVGDTITIQAIPYAGYHFLQWEDGSTQPVRRIVVMEDVVYTASFAPNDYQLQVFANDDKMGVVKGSGTYAYKSYTTLTATPSVGYQFLHWSDHNTYSEHRVCVTSDTIITAYFAPKSYHVNATASDTQKGSVIGGGVYAYGDTIELTAIPNLGCQFVEWADGVVDNPRQIVVTEDITITAEFEVLYLKPDTVTICYGEEYTWNNKTYKTSGFYTETIEGLLDTLYLTVLPAVPVTECFDTICHGETYEWQGMKCTKSGFYNATLQDVNGCDSLLTLHLTILPEAVTTTEKAAIGSDELPYTWRGNTYSATGRYTIVKQYTTIACDSAIYVLDLRVLTTGNVDEQSVTICDSEVPYIWHGESYSATGKYTYTEKYVGTDIDSIQHILNLIVNPTIYAEKTITACDSYVWNDQTYTESGEYVYNTIATNGCDSIVTLHLTINQTQYAEVTATACDSYTWNDQTYTQSGEYVYNTTASNGCDSIVTLHLTINKTQYAEVTAIACDSYVWNGETYTQSGDYTYNTTASNGCDSIVTLHLTINNTQYAEEYVTACDSYVWNDQTYSESGEYVYNTTATNGCDSIVTLHLTINQTQYAEVTATACDSYVWNGQTYTESGEYIYNTTAANGCDSIVTLHLTINQTQYAEVTTTACDSYVWNGETYTASGEYTYTTTAANGCDSIVTLHLTINKTQYAEETITACDSYTWNDQTYTQSGEYVYNTTAANGCDSIVTLHLTINKTQYAEVTATACDSYVWNDQTYTESGEYVYNTTVSNGCDSIVTLHLTINQTQYAEVTATACDSYVWNGETYTQSGEYVYTTTAANGCDSIVTLHLTINQTQYAEESVTACDSYTWNDQTYTESGEYVYNTTASNGCDSIVTLHLTINQTQYAEETVVACDSYAWNGETYTQSGDYTFTTVAANGCDSIVTLHLTINNSEYVEESVTACDSYEWHGVVYTESGDYTYTTTTEQGCERVEVLHLTILPDATTESEELALCPSELPYEWYGQRLTEAGSYTATEQYAGMECDSIIHELTLNVYVQTLPASVTLPIIREGEAIDVTIPTAEIQAHIAAETWYAPNAEVAWYIMDNSDWAALTSEPVKAGISQVTLKYAVATDCGNVESDDMVIDVIPTSVDNTNSQSPISDYQKILYEDHIYILRNGKIYSIMGHEM